MPSRLSTAALTLCAALSLAGCEELCKAGVKGKCPPCTPAEVPQLWEQPILASLVPGGDAIVCEATADEAEYAQLSYWVPRRVHDSNVEVVSTAQGAGWIRTRDNWYDENDSSQMAKWSEFGRETGDKLRLDLKAEAGGTRIIVRVDAVPRSPQLRGDVSILAYRDASYALQAGRVIGLPGVIGGASLPAAADGFYFRAARTQYGHYQPDGTAVVHPAFPVNEGEGFTSAHGPGPRGVPWMSHNPRDRKKPLLLGELVDGAWELEEVAGLSPRVPAGYADAVVTQAGATWLLIGDVLYAKDARGWQGTKLGAKAAPLRPIVAESDSVLVSTEHDILRARLEHGRIKLDTVASLEFYPELYDAGTAGVVARTREAVVLIHDQDVTTLELPGEHQAPDIATSTQGVIAVATKSPSAVIVRKADGTITQYPELSHRVASMSIDALGRVWILLVDGDPVVADRGSLTPLPGLTEDGRRPTSVTFMGNGAPPLLSAIAAAG